jgi:hypothetical protein
MRAWPVVRTDRDAGALVQLHPNYGNPNGNSEGDCVAKVNCFGSFALVPRRLVTE